MFEQNKVIAPILHVEDKQRRFMNNILQSVNRAKINYFT